YVEHVLDSRDGWIHALPHDVDGDGRMDIVATVAQEHEQVVWFRNLGGLTFEPIVLFEAPHPAWGLTGMDLVDLDGDGYLDVLLTNGDTIDDNILKPYHGIAQLRNLGPGREGAARFRYEEIARMPGC